MDATATTSPDHPGIYCPSCAALVTESAVASGTTLRCPVCGTEFTAGTSTVEEPTAAEAPRKLSTQEILLERFKNAPPEKKPASWSTAAVIVTAIIAIVFSIVKITSKKDVYAPMDSTTARKMAFYQPIIDSLQQRIADQPNDMEAHVELADAYYDMAEWDKSRKEFETYLAVHPDSANARVDYAYAVAQQSGDLALAVREIDTVLQYRPNHLNALLNGGILSAEMVQNGNHEEGIAKARDYFERAKAVAQRSDTAMVGRIDQLLDAINQTGKKPAAPKLQ